MRGSRLSRWRTCNAACHSTESTLPSPCTSSFVVPTFMVGRPMINIGPTGMLDDHILCGADLYGRPTDDKHRPTGMLDDHILCGADLYGRPADDKHRPHRHAGRSHPLWGRPLWSA